MRHLLLTAALTLMAYGAAANTGPVVPPQNWSFDSVRADWNPAEIRRGYEVFANVCMACHSAKYISHRDLMRAGLTEADAKAMADAMGKKLDEKLVSGMDAATAQESFGKVPPDLSLITKARAGGADYVYALLTGYSEDPQTQAEMLPGGVPAGASFNTAFAGHAIAMPNPLTGPDLVTYSDGTAATVQQMAKDVTTFLQWTAEPERVERHRLGVYVLLFLVGFTLLAYLTKRAIWKSVGH